ncbi:hypothetical protein HK100_007900, partial [Physocladia obscura]
MPTSVYFIRNVAIIFFLSAYTVFTVYRNAKFINTSFALTSTTRIFNTSATITTTTAATATATNAPEHPPPDPAAPPNCPTWKPFAVKQQGDKDFSNNCRVIVDENPSFSVTLCESMRECGQGYFLIQRKDEVQCAKAMAKSIAWEPEFDAWMKSTIGPDAFTVIFSGPQRASPSDWRHLGSCQYKHPYRLTNPGNYTVSITHTHAEFHAIQEKKRTWQRIVNEPILVEFALDACSTLCQPFSVRSVEEEWRKMKGRVPVCSRVMPVQGVYLRSGLEGMVDRERYKYDAFKVPYF